MDKDTVSYLKKTARNAELKVTESILKWAYRREGKDTPSPETFQEQSQMVTDQVHEILVRRGGNLWNELKSLVKKE